MEDTPPPEDYQKWCDELYAELPDLSDHDEESSRSKYDLRIEAREKINVPTTFLDQDESGTFDPTHKRAAECMPINRKNTGKKAAGRGWGV